MGRGQGETDGQIIERIAGVVGSAPNGAIILAHTNGWDRAAFASGVARLVGRGKTSVTFSEMFGLLPPIQNTISHPPGHHIPE